MADERHDVYISEEADSAFRVQRDGRQAVKRPSPVWLVRAKAGTVVRTDTGELVMDADGFVAYDPVSGYVWPLSREYVDLHYDFVDGQHIDSWPV